MTRKVIFVILLIVVVGGCTQYTYHGTIEELDADGNMRTHLVYWTKTERKFWFDESSGSIRLLTQCSLRTINFDESEDGIIFYSTINDEGVLRDDESKIPEIGLKEPCGRIIGVKKINQLEEGTLRLEIYCKFVAHKFASGNQTYIKARDGVYEFQIIREESLAFKNGVPKRPVCP